MKKRINEFLLFLLLMMPVGVHAADYLICGNGRRIPYVLSWGVSVVYVIIRIIVPILFVVTGMVSFFKAVLSSKAEDELQKAKKSLVSKIIAAVIIFFIASIVNFVISLAVGRGNNFSSCLECMLRPKNCVIDNSSVAKLCPGLLSEQSNYDDNCVYQGSKNRKLNYSNTGNTGVSNTPKQNNTNSSNNINSNNNTNNITSNFKKPDSVDVKKTDGLTYMNGILIVNKSYSIPSTYKPSNALGQDNCLLCLTDDTLSAFNEMKDAASNEGFKLTVVSGFRSYSYQKNLYDTRAKDNKANADAGTARPGYSEHQTGLAFDINQVSDSFANTPEGKWVASNCYKYGFVIRYPEGKSAYTGFKYEPWHLRYVGKDLAQILYNNGEWVSLEEYFDISSEYKN